MFQRKSYVAAIEHYTRALGHVACDEEEDMVKILNNRSAVRECENVKRKPPPMLLPLLSSCFSPSRGDVTLDSQSSLLVCVSFRFVRLTPSLETGRSLCLMLSVRLELTLLACVLITAGAWPCLSLGTCLDPCAPSSLA